MLNREAVGNDVAMKLLPWYKSKSPICEGCGSFGSVVT